MSLETVFSIKQGYDDIALRAGQNAQVQFSGKEFTVSDRHRLFFTCEDRKFYLHKAESSNEMLYMLLDDSLDTDHAVYSTYCLNMSCSDPKSYAKRASYKLSWPPAYPLGNLSEVWTFGIYAKAKDLVIETGGYLRFKAEIWERREGEIPGATNRFPDRTATIDIASGTYDYTGFSQQIPINHQTTACILLTLEGMRYSGSVYFEQPHLMSFEGENLVPDFDRNVLSLEHFAWCGQNLSKREWPQFQIALNGTVFFDGEVFLSMHRYSPVELDIPQWLLREDSNTLSITYTSDYHEVLPVAIREIAILQTPAGPFAIHYCPDFIVNGEDLHILLETFQENMALKLDSTDFTAASSLVFPEKGLHVLTLHPLQARNGLSFRLDWNGFSRSCTVSRTVTRKEDHVLCGSGDMIYLDNSDEKAIKDYLIWFIGNEIGKLLTIRPVYHWGGQRTLNPKVWELVTKICNSMGYSYVLMSDGRDLSSIDKNPSVQELEGPGFLGRQVHERDGQLIYWGLRPRDTIPTTSTFFDMAMQLTREDPAHAEGNYLPWNISFRDGYTSLRRDPVEVADRKLAHDTVAKELQLFAKDFSRHTGPSVMFKYFYEQGFRWVGAETLDGSLEAQLAFLRGAAKAYGQKRTGIHHALQWSTLPHDTPKRYRRFMLANYLSYMHGMTDINTEEGFWFMEHGFSYHNRLSSACREHRLIQKRFHNYISTHSRTGTFYTSTAFLHGRYDGWNGFGGNNLWGMEKLPLGESEKSWSLLNIFYPLNKVSHGGMGHTGYIPEDYNKPFGCYTGTPLGNVDVIPVENGTFRDYKLLCFAGYNAADPDDLDRLLSYVQDGGTLVATWPHFSTTTNQDDILHRKHTILKHPLTALLSDGVPVFTEDTVNGKRILVCGNLSGNATTLQKTDNGNALILSLDYGMGKIYLLNALSYPGEETVRVAYQDLITHLHIDLLNQEPIQLACGTDVGYTIYRQENGDLHIYITPVDWYHDPDFTRHAVLVMGEDRFTLDLPFGQITKVVYHDGLAAWVTGMDAEILTLQKGTVTIQGSKSAVLFTAQDSCIQSYPLSFDKDPILNVSL